MIHSELKEAIVYDPLSDREMSCLAWYADALVKSPSTRLKTTSAVYTQLSLKKLSFTASVTIDTMCQTVGKTKTRVQLESAAERLLRSEDDAERWAGRFLQGALS